MSPLMSVWRIPPVPCKENFPGARARPWDIAGRRRHRAKRTTIISACTALDKPLDVPPGAEKKALLDAMAGHVLGEGMLVGTYHR